MTELIARPFLDEFLEHCKNAEGSIKLCAPFVKTDIITQVIETKRKGVSLGLITKVNLKNFHVNVSDVDALSQTLEMGGSVYNCSNLHAKIYIFDDNACFITSANLTPSGLQRNVECGVFSSDKSLVNSVVGVYSNIIGRSDVGTITEDTLNVVPVEITETRQRTIKVDAIDVKEAIRIVRKQYSNGEVALGKSECTNVGIDVFPSVRAERISCDEDIRKVIDYLWDDEEHHWMESEYASDHIFNVLRRLKKKYG